LCTAGKHKENLEKQDTQASFTEGRELKRIELNILFEILYLVNTGVSKGCLETWKSAAMLAFVSKQ